jgi:hypothetical protein
MGPTNIVSLPIHFILMPKAFENNSIIGKSQFDVCGAAIRTQFA